MEDDNQNKPMSQETSRRSTNDSAIPAVGVVGQPSRLSVRASRPSFVRGRDALNRSRDGCATNRHPRHTCTTP